MGFMVLLVSKTSSMVFVVTVVFEVVATGKQSLFKIFIMEFVPFFRL